MKKKAHKVTPPKPKAPSKKKIVKQVVTQSKPAAKPSSAKAAPLPDPAPAPDDLSTLGRQSPEFFKEKYGENHFRIIDNTGFVFSGGRWVAVDVDGFTYMEREICTGDPEFVAV